MHFRHATHTRRYYKETSERCLRFGHFLGCFNKPDELPEYDIRVDGWVQHPAPLPMHPRISSAHRAIARFVLHVLDQLREQHAKKSVDAG